MKYKAYMRHAVRVIKKIEDHNKRLRGIKLFEDGSAVVTDSFRLYLAKDIHNREHDVLISGTGTSLGEEKLKNYPDAKRIIPYSSDAMKSIVFSIKEFLQAAELMQIASKIGTEGFVFFKDNNIVHESFDELNSTKDKTKRIQASYTFSQPVDIDLIVDVDFLVDALKLFRSFKYDELTLNYYSRLRPFTLVSPDEKLLTLISPMRRH